ncbi:hypothetical protein ONZ45_g4761 [Pleurotus djamor]|nr:hypothetical protein ONZ45_g4761 [Pleurotus djamor]
MKFSTALFASALLAVQAIALPASSGVDARDVAPCPTFNHVPALFSAYNANLTDTYYATSEAEMLKAWVKRGYTPILVNARIFEDQKSSTVPLYRLYNKQTTSHFYTINEAERQTFKGKGYADTGIVGYLYPSQICGSVPWYRMFNAKDGDYYYTPDANQKSAAIARGYVVQGVAGYVYMP